MERRAQGGTPPLAGQDPVQTFYDYVNRVALLCQTKTGGDAVSACTVLKKPSGVVYAFTSNSREDFQLRFVAEELTAILKMVPLRNGGDDHDILALRQQILLRILSLVKSRIKCYFNSLGECLENCIADCERGYSGNG